MVRAMTPRPERMREAASGLLLATEVADYLVGRGMPFRSAHALVGRIVRDLVAAGRDFNALSLTDWQRYDPIFDDGIFPALTPEAAVRARVTPQSTNPGAVAEALADARAWIAARTQD
jgi:argininosuccinate lyase